MNMRIYWWESDKDVLIASLQGKKLKKAKVEKQSQLLDKQIKQFEHLIANYGNDIMKDFTKIDPSMNRQQANEWKKKGF